MDKYKCTIKFDQPEDWFACLTYHACNNPASNRTPAGICMYGCIYKLIFSHQAGRFVRNIL